MDAQWDVTAVLSAEDSGQTHILDTMGKWGGIATAARISSFGPISNAWQLLVLLVARDTNEKTLRDLIKTNDVNIAVKKNVSTIQWLTRVKFITD